jgi:esterase/lipase superfamily enzyme
MHVRWFGHGGARLLAFPSSMGNHNEWPNRYMPDVLGEHIRNGWITLFSIDHNHDVSWYNKEISPRERAAHHLRYGAYFRDELLPFTANVNPTPFVITTGASFGAFHAMSLAMRNPTLVQRVIGMSGMYDIAGMANNSNDELVYKCNPAAFIPNEWQEDRLDALRRQDIIIAIGKGDPSYEENQAFSAALWRKGIGNALRVWDGHAHDWPWWERMIVKYVGGHD